MIRDELIHLVGRLLHLSRMLLACTTYEVLIDIHQRLAPEQLMHALLKP